MDTCRILIIGQPFTPIFELGHRISEFHDLDYITLELSNDKVRDGYFADKIPTLYLDTGDYSTGSEDMMGVRDPSSLSGMKALDEVSFPDPEEPLNESEKESLLACERCVVASQILDPWLGDNWSDIILYLKVDEDKAVEWLSGRRKCFSCGATYHVKDRPQKAEPLCDRCGSHVGMMEKDMPESVRAQFKAWRKRSYKIELDAGENKEGFFASIDVDNVKDFDEIVTLAERFLRDKIGAGSLLNWGYRI